MTTSPPLRRPPLSHLLVLAAALALLAACGSGLGPGGEASPRSDAPASGAAAGGSADAAVLAELPFAYDDPQAVWVDLAPEGHRPFTWQLDTGAPANFLSPRAARARSVSVRRLKNTPYQRSTVLGRSVSFWVDTRSSDTAARGFEYAFLGGQFLQQYVVEIDLSRRRVRFLDPDRYQVPAESTASGEHVLPLRVSGRRPFVVLGVGDRQTQVLLDTGAPSTIVSGETATELGLAWQEEPSVELFYNVAAPMDSRVVEAPAARLGDAELGTLPVAVSPAGASNRLGVTDSALGLDALRPFVVRIDYPRRRLWLKRVDDGPPTFLGVPYAPARRAGALVAALPGGELVVAAVLPDTPAEELGLQPGDRITAPSHREVDADAFLERVAESREVTVARRRNDVWVDVVLPDLTGAE